MRTVANAFCPGAGPKDNSCPPHAGGSERAALLVQKWHHDIDEQDHLTGRQKADYKEAFLQVIGAMPEEAVNRIARNLNKVLWAPDVPSVNRAFEKISGEKLLPGQITNGFYATGSGTMCVDGPTYVTQQSGAYNETEGVPNMRGTYSHELGHAIDGHGEEFSSSKEWKDSYEKEIVGDKSQAPSLSEYARTDPSEGFAEFCRLIYGSGFSHGSDKQIHSVMRRMPRCFYFFRSRGLLP